MVPADLDDEQRARLAHEHPTDLDSGPSSPSSGIPSFTHHSKSASRRRSHAATTEGSSSSHLLARLVSREEEIREINATLVVTTERLEGESSRANAAERRALDYFHRLRIATENRERAEQESARLREELKLYKLQLENAQKEIFRAQDIIDQVATQRNEAEAEAARARSKARKLQEEKLVMLAREEGRRMGYKEGLSIGRRIGYDEENFDGDISVPERDDEGITDDERNDPRPRLQLRPNSSIRQPLTRPESAPPVRMPEASAYAPPLPVRVHTPSQDHRMPSPPRDPDEPETIRPIPIRISPIIPPQPINTPPPDGWIPRADSHTSFISVPPPHELQQPIPMSPRSVADEIRDDPPSAPQQSEPMPVPPPPVRSRDYAYQTESAPPPVPRTHTPSVTSHTSTHISQYDLVNKRPGSSLRNEIYVGRAGSGGQPTRESFSRNEHRDSERRYSDQTEAEYIAEQWRADSDADSPPPPRNPPRSMTPSGSSRSHRPVQFYSRPRETGDADSRSRTPMQSESAAAAAMHLRPPPESLTSSASAQTPRTRTPLEHLRQRFRQRPASNSSIPNIIVESPSEPETTMSPSVTTIAAQPELLSPEAANRPLPQDDYSTQRSRSHSYTQSQPPPSSQSHRRSSTPAYDSHTYAPSRSGTPSSSAPWPPAGFMPYPTPARRGGGSSAGVEFPRPGGGGTTSSERERDQDRRRAYADPPPIHDSRTYGRPPPRTRTQSSSSLSVPGRTTSGTYETAPLPPGVSYPAPPTRPHTSHRRHRGWDRDWEQDRDRDREKDRERAREPVRSLDWDRDRERDKRRDSERDYERERDRDREKFRDRDRDWDRNRARDRREDTEDTGLDEELTRSPAPLQRPISLFDSDEA